MKSYRHIILCAAVLVTGGFSMVKAETGARAVADKQPSAAPVAKKPRNRLENLTQRLHLSDVQKLKVEAVVKDQQAAEAALKADSAMSADAKKAKRAEIVKAHDEQIRALLTPDQVPAFDEMTSHRFGAAKKSG